MPQFRISQVAELLDVSDDTVRRLITAGKLPAAMDNSGRHIVDGVEVARYARSLTHDNQDGDRVSARNRLPGIVTDVKIEGLVAQVEIAVGRFRLVSLMTRDAAEEMQLAPGVAATAVIKATTAIVERTP
ncbi:TOBE domain-containing protein [Hoyosella rhizosphaerae]|uniref:MerR family transcriptional regulator n=1 Tax=Hoyosella rhizosphaerae TaxID=1755582 RepID=A0A916XAQ6_9ACTN|nr:TOBE domain-containing protein [Hoyosella rhizosphaerae]MBN4926742.1 TOBE domain-containing protein [Hoyosella rhizosphaerae]GGC56838.1 MerR family transcriptional regulator [Hoyosella rhizosphaerae]